MPALKYFLLVFVSLHCIENATSQKNSNYINNRAPLIEKPYLELPLGSIKARGWLEEQLIRQKKGLTGTLDKYYPLVMGDRNGWLGGDGDQWERGPYWLDGLLPLAYILNDSALKAKVKPWIEWSLQNQQEDGYFGPLPQENPYAHEEGIQRGNIRDWWPKMVMLKVLQQHYSATGDERVINLMTKYFKYQLKNLPKTPLDHWTRWAGRRGGDNLMVVYWLYNITGDKFLLDLASLIHNQTSDWTDIFLNQDLLSKKGSIHAVNLAMGIKEPVIFYQQGKDSLYLNAVEKGFHDLMKFNGQPHGMFGGDERLHGNDPTKGTELCTIVEMMYSLESMLTITGKLDFAERLERIAFNALPTQATDNYMERQYFQQANQIMVTRHIRNFSHGYNGTPNLFGLLTGYPCCTSNMHQGWPKFTQNLWYGTADGGLAALVYSPSEVTAKVGDGVEVNFVEETSYPFEESIRFTFSRSTQDEVKFPFHLRIPKWCEEATILINGEVFTKAGGKKIVIVNREWRVGDVVELQVPMVLSSGKWHENSLSIEHGPLVYGLRIEENWERIENTVDPKKYGEYYYEVLPESPWNYGLYQDDNANLLSTLEVKRIKPVAKFPWNLKNAPVIIKAKAKRIPQWKLYNDMAGPVIYSPFLKARFDRHSKIETDVEEITLIPYGCTTLRISAFPVVK